MDRRRSPRVGAFLPVRVWGVDSHWLPFMQQATVKNISTGGAVVQGMQHRVAEGTVLEVQYEDAKAQFRVVWVGNAEMRNQGEIGIQMLPSEQMIWHVNLDLCSEMVGTG
jgi:PilZ domain